VGVCKLREREGFPAKAPSHLVGAEHEFLFELNLLEHASSVLRFVSVRIVGQHSTHRVGGDSHEVFTAVSVGMRWSGWTKLEAAGET
jgi:hypothetical protein